MTQRIPKRIKLQHQKKKKEKIVLIELQFIVVQSIHSECNQYEKKNQLKKQGLLLWNSFWSRASWQLLTVFDEREREKEKKKRAFVMVKLMLLFLFIFQFSIALFVAAKFQCVVRVTPNAVVIITISVAVVWPVVFSHPYFHCDCHRCRCRRSGRCCRSNRQ